MNDYLLIESRDCFECGDVRAHCELALAFARAGHRVRMFLVQNGVLPVRHGARAPGFDALLQAGVPVLAEEDSLRERGISPLSLRAGVNPAPLELVIDALAAGARVLWR